MIEKNLIKKKNIPFDSIENGVLSLQNEIKKIHELGMNKVLYGYVSDNELKDNEYKIKIGGVFFSILKNEKLEEILIKYDEEIIFIFSDENIDLKIKDIFFHTYDPYYSLKILPHDNECIVAFFSVDHKDIELYFKENLEKYLDN